MPVTPNDNTKRTNSTGSPTTLGGSYKQGKMVTEHVPSQVNNLQVNNMHIGSQVPSYVVNNGTLNNKTNQGDFNALQLRNDQHNDKPLEVNFQSSNKSQNSLDRVVQVVKSHQQVLSNLNEFMVTRVQDIIHQ